SGPPRGAPRRPRRVIRDRPPAGRGALGSPASVDAGHTSGERVGWLGQPTVLDFLLDRPAVPLGRARLGELAAETDDGAADCGEDDDLGEADARVVGVVAGRLVPGDELPADIEQL